MTRIEALRALYEAVKNGRYDRENGPHQYYAFCEASTGIIPGTRMERMAMLRGGKGNVLACIAALIAIEERGE